MNISNSHWLKALTLLERIPATGAEKRPVTNGKLELARQRLKRWQSQTPFTTNDYFAQRLNIDQLTEAEFLDLLGESEESLSNRFPAAAVWIKELQQVLSAANYDDKRVLTDEDLRRRHDVGFLTLVEPLIHDGRWRLHEGARALRQTYPVLPFDPDTIVDVFVKSLLDTLIWRLSRTAVLELNVARVEGLLEGETPQERYASFVKRLGRSDLALDILKEYPVLTRHIKTLIDQWVNYSLEFLTHLAKDWTTIRETLSPSQDPGQLTAVTIGAGDTHRQGRSVMTATFASGFRLIYKPHSLAVDRHFVELLSWLNERGTHPPFLTMKVIDRGTYGWAEFIVAHGCQSKEELDRFYERQGGYLALLYALEATDFHLENLIAAGEHPVLVDLESLFHARNLSKRDDTATELILRIMEHSVLRIGMLPQRMWAEGTSDGVDLSGLGGASGQFTPYRVLQPESEGTDNMRFVRKQVEMPGSNNRPNLNGETVSAHEYVESITKGFTGIYRLILKHRDELLADGGPLAAFADDEVRTVLRPTRLYAMLLFESYHPNLLRDALDRDRLLDGIWIGIEQMPYLDRVIPHELKDLQNGDIPMFLTRPGSRHLWSSRNQEITDFFIEPSMNSVRRRLQSLNEDDLSRQLWFTRASLTTLIMGLGQDQWIQYQPEVSNQIADRDRLIAAARKVAERLEVLAQRDKDTALWVGVTLVNERNWTLLPVEGDLYDGTSGIALFLAYLGSITGEERFTALAKAALAATKSQLELLLAETKLPDRFGGFTNLGGVVYALAHLGKLWNDTSLFDEAERVVNRLRELIDDDEYLDVLGGAAGAIVALLSLYKCTSSDNALAVAIQCAEQLVARAEPMSSGAAWCTNNAETERPLSGFSHGTAGIAWALLELFAVTGDERYRKAALDGINYERSLFVPEAGNWLDIRELKPLEWIDHEKQRFMVAWCHGAVGIGLARLLSLPHVGRDDAEVRAEIDVAIRTTLERGFGLNHCLCHGDLGNLDLLLQAGSVFNNPQLTRRTYEIASSILDSMDKHGWLCGVPMGVETPGLMTGLAGIGYGLLRLAEPEFVPSILTLAPPPNTNAPKHDDFLPSSFTAVIEHSDIKGVRV